MRRGVDLRAAGDSHEALELLKPQSKHCRQGKASTVGDGQHPVSALPDAGLLDETFPQRPVVAINDDKSYCWMNRAAEERYAFTAAECSAEARISLLNEMLADSGQLKDDMRAFMVRLAAQGITAIKTFVSTTHRH